MSIGCAPDGFNINAGFGATAPHALVDGRAPSGADYGIALDGDADRLQMVDAAGRLYNGDELLYVLVADRLAQGMAVPGVVGTLMTNMAVELALRGARRRRSCAPRSATATCSRSWSRAAGSSAARARATCWRSTSTPPATASSARCMVLQAVVRAGPLARRAARRRRRCFRRR